MRLALCQVRTEPWAIEANLKRLLRSFEAAAAAGADLAVTPECVLHGYGRCRTDRAKARLQEDVAEDVDGPRLVRIRSKLRELGLSAVVGFTERGRGDAVHNSAALILRDGSVANVYRKVHLRPFEDVTRGGGYTAGEAFAAHALKFGHEQTCVVGTMICFDREIPESVRCLRAMGAQLVVCPLATDTTPLQAPADGNATNELVTRCRAAENEVFVAVVNHAGRFNGGSYVVGPRGEVVLQMGPEPGVEVADVPVGAVRDGLHSNPWGWMGWGFRRPAVYARHLPGERAGHGPEGAARSAAGRRPRPPDGSSAGLC